MSNKATIFYVEDDATLSFLTKDNLELNGYDVNLFTDGKSAIENFPKGNYDLCILDVMLPEMDGYELAEKIRQKNSQVPILFLTAKSLKEDRLKGLRLGADDYITKPFSIEELMLKIEIFLKRKYISNTATKVIPIGNYSFNYPNLSLEYANKENISLTQKEGDLLKLLATQANAVVKREIILEQIWGENDYFLGRSMDVFISRLRKYLKNDTSIKIENIHGVGFRLNTQIKS